MDDKTFMKVSELIDPEDPNQVPFFELFNEIMDQRNKEPTKSSKCAIFWTIPFVLWLQRPF